nr:ATP-binding protein [uncultured Roseateles sp.]
MLQRLVPDTLARQLALAIGGLILLMLLTLAAIAYGSVGLLLSDALPGVMLRNVELRAASQGQLLAQAEGSVNRLHAEWQRRAAELDPVQTVQQFDRLFVRSADGVWRLRPELINTDTRPSFYLQHGVRGPSASARQRAVLSYELLREQGPALVPPYFSAYVDFVEKGLMVFSRGIDWGQGATPATDNFDYPTMKGSDPRANPGRQLFWTPVYFDAEAKAWMVSVIKPLDWQGSWVGTVGHDIAIDALLSGIGDALQPGASAMILNDAGDLIAHPHLRERIQQAQGQLSLGAVRDPLIGAIHQLTQRAAREGEHALTGASADGEQLLAVARIPGPGWWSVLVLPRALLKARLQPAIGVILAVGLLCLLITLLVLRRLIHRLVRRPLGRLTRVVDALRAGREVAPVALRGRGELVKLADTFDSMAGELAQQRRAQERHAAELEQQIAERRQAEAVVQALNHTLEARVAERTEALQRARDELVQKETLAGLGSLVAGISHELNTPIGNALMASGTMLAAMRELDASVQTGAVRRSEMHGQINRAMQAAELALGNLQRSAELVGDFKQVALDRSHLVKRRFRLRQVIEETLSLLRLSFRQEECRLEIDIPAELELDSYAGPLGQVLTNLVQNALLHGLDGRSDGCISIRVEGHDGQRVRLAVSDNGRGIAPEHQAKIFQPFFTTKLGQGGSGLGLHIVYTIVTGVLGGRIELRSQAGEGSCFVIELPVDGPVSVPAAATDS